MFIKEKGNLEKGSIAIYAIVTVFCFVIILTGVFMYSSGIRDSQIKTALEIKKVYEERIDQADEIAESLSQTSWYYDGEGNVTNGTKTLKIGDYVDYESVSVDYTSTDTENGYGDCNFGNYTGTWQVLGVDETSGQVLLISSESVGSLYLSGQTGYENCETELEYIGSLYANGDGATDGRSVTVDDINRITGYNPNNVGEYDPDQSDTGTACNSGMVSEYGNEVTYTKNGTSGYIDYQGTKYPADLTTQTDYNTFTYYTGTEWKSFTNGGDTATLTSTYYYYYPTTLTESSTGDNVGITTDSAAYSLLFGSSYWLGSSYTITAAGRAVFGCRIINDVSVSYDYLYFSHEDTTSPCYNVRSVVYLDTSVTFSPTDETHWTMSV